MRLLLVLIAMVRYVSIIFSNNKYNIQPNNFLEELTDTSVYNFCLMFLTKINNNFSPGPPSRPPAAELFRRVPRWRVWCWPAVR